jgi:FkbM family methyltransferase
MIIPTKLKRATRELLGMRQWPRKGVPRPCSFEEQIYCALVSPGDVCYDIGANCGEVSLFLARLAGPSGLVVSFEPTWPMYLQLCTNIQYDLNSKAPIVTVPAGLSDRCAEAAIHVPDGCFALASIATLPEWAKCHDQAAIETHNITLLTLDVFIQTTRLASPKFVKIDVEGAELLVIQGAIKTFRDNPAPIMLIEMFAPWEKAFGYEPWDLLSVLAAQGYRFLFACEQGLVGHTPSRAEPFPPEFEAGYNVIALQSTLHDAYCEILAPLRASSGRKTLPMLPPPKANQVT